MKQSKFPPGWDQKRVQRVLKHYEQQTEEEALAEDEAAYEDSTQAIMEVPRELVPSIRELIAKHKRTRGPNPPLESTASIGRKWKFLLFSGSAGSRYSIRGPIGSPNSFLKTFLACVVRWFTARSCNHAALISRRPCGAQEDLPCDVRAGA